MEDFGRNVFDGTPPECVPNQCFGGLLAGYDNSACDGKRPGETCIVACEAGYVYQAPIGGGQEYSGEGALFLCEASGVFSGMQPTCERQTCDAISLPAPTTAGADFSSCLGVGTGE